MSGVVIIIAIWCVIAFIYSRFAKISFWKANGNMIKGIIESMFESTVSKMNDVKREAKKQGNEEAYYKAEAYQNFAKSELDEIKRAKKGE